LRILICLEDGYRSYREAIAIVLQTLRPRAKVVASGLDALREEVRRLDPHLVICSLPVTAGYGDMLGWVELSLESSRPTVVWINGRCSEQSDATLEDLLKIIDEIDQLI
jgi:hypothetical protein